jgi:hypothetical protein
MNPSIREEIYQNRVFDYMQMNSDFMALISWINWTWISYVLNQLILNVSKSS